MSTKEATVQISDTIKELASKFNIKVDPKTGVATFDESVYVANMPENVTVESIKAIHNYNQQFVSAQALALGEASIPVLKKNGELLETSIEVVDPTGNKFSSVFQRSILTGPPGGERTEKFGSVKSSVELRAARKTGEFGKVRTHLAALATAQLAGK